MSYNFFNTTTSSSQPLITDVNYPNAFGPKIQLNGASADIVLNGVSIRESLSNIESRLAILKPNPELESRWDRLRELREEYQKLEVEILEKERMWNQLKK